MWTASPPRLRSTVYNMALDEFMVWFQQAPPSGFTKATVSARRVSPEDCRLDAPNDAIKLRVAI